MKNATVESFDPDLPNFPSAPCGTAISVLRDSKLLLNLNGVGTESDHSRNFRNAKIWNLPIIRRIIISDRNLRSTEICRIVGR